MYNLQRVSKCVYNIYAFFLENDHLAIILKNRDMITMYYYQYFVLLRESIIG